MVMGENGLFGKANNAKEQTQKTTAEETKKLAVLENRTKEKLINFVYLAKETDEIENAIENKIIKSEKQIRVLKFLEENEEATVSDIEMFTEASRAIVKTLEKNGFVEIVAKEVERNPFIHKNIQRDEKRKQLYIH